MLAENSSLTRQVPWINLWNPIKKRLSKNAPLDDNRVAASMPGTVITLAVAAGEKVREGQKLMVLEAMKMETTVNVT